MHSPVVAWKDRIQLRCVGLLLQTLLVLPLLAAPALADICIIPDNGTGTGDLPPVGPECITGYLSPTDVHMIIDGLPPGSTILADAEHSRFFPTGGGPGGNLGGEIETFTSDITLQLEGTGLLAGFSRVIVLSGVPVETHIGPRNPGDRVQQFPNEMVALQGQLFGDPDFDFLQITAGTANGLSSSGQTTLAQQADGDFVVDSFFDITYQIEFVGAPGSVLDGMAGTTTSSIEMRQGNDYSLLQALPCLVDEPPLAGQPIPLPPDCLSGQGYVSPTDLHEMIAGLPPGTTIEIKPEHRSFFNVIVGPGGLGQSETFDSELVLELTGTGALAGFQRQIQMPVAVETTTEVQGTGSSRVINTEMVQMQGQLFGDPDFDSLQIVAGQPFALPPSPGLTRLDDLGNGKWNVDSFFDITYRIEFVGAPGGALDGFGGATEATVRMEAGVPIELLPPLPVGSTPPIPVPVMGLGGIAVLGAGLWTTAALVRRRRRE